MNPHTGSIVNHQLLASLETHERQKFVTLSDEQYETVKPMKASDRKGYMRNQLCPCGSGVKFKRCHWNNIEDLPKGS